MNIFTIGVYNTSENEFFAKLINNRIDTFCDIRQRRGMRGHQYSFVNSIYLQKKLNTLGIHYCYFKELAPTKEIREKQWKDDAINKEIKKNRTLLGNGFISDYRSLILENFDLSSLIDTFSLNNSNNIVLFCVEEKASACHRSLVAEELNKCFGFPIYNL